MRFQRTFFNTFIVERAKLPRLIFAPTAYAFNRHAQTGVLFMLSHIEWLWQQQLFFRREFVDSGDRFKSKLHLDWAVWHGEDEADAVEGPAGDRPRSFARVIGPEHEYEANHVRDHGDDSHGSPILLLIHGLGDSTDHPYIKRLSRAAQRMGWRVCCFSYWRADWYNVTDLRTIIDHISAKYPESPLVAVAWSAGGHMLMRFLSEVGKSTPLVAAISLSGVFDLSRVIANIMKTDNPMYRVFLSQQLKICFHRHCHNDPRFFSTASAPPELNRDRVMAFVMEKFGEPLVMYDRFQYSLCSPGLEDQWTFKGPRTRHLYPPINFESISVTTLVVQADDDPIVHGWQTHWGRLLSNKNIICLHTKRGGHVAHYDQWFPFGDTYMDRVTIRFVSAVLESHSYTRFLVTVVRNSLREIPDLSQSMSSGNLARIVSRSDLAQLIARK